MTARSITAIGAVLAVAIGACGEPELPYPVRIRATSDGAPLAGVEISLGGDVVGSTGVDGILYVEIDGEEGQSLSLAANCPPGYADPDAVSEVRLRRVSGFAEDGAPRAVEREVPCAPALRHVVVLVRTDGLAELPVHVDGLRIGETNDHGVMHLAFRGEPRRSFEVRLDTESRPALRPSDPTRTFSVPAEQDDLVVWNVEMRRPSVGHRPRPPRPRMNGMTKMGPVRLR